MTLQLYFWVHIQKKQNQRAQRHLHSRVYDCTVHKSQSMKSAYVSTYGWMGTLKESRIQTVRRSVMNAVFLDMLLNSKSLWLCAQDLNKVKPAKFPAQVCQPAPSPSESSLQPSFYSGRISCWAQRSLIQLIHLDSLPRGSSVAVSPVTGLQVAPHLPSFWQNVGIWTPDMGPMWKMLYH